MKEHYATTVNVQGAGNSPATAVTDALGRVAATVLGSTSKVLLRIEPVDVNVLQANCQTRNERFLLFFLPRTRYRYSVSLEITVNITAIDAENINFTTQ